VLYGIEEQIPCCPLCGTARVFELQLLSSLLHVLQVDRQAVGNLSSAFTHGGMDWGNIVVYTCPSCQVEDGEEYCVVQDSVDERPMGPQRQPQQDVYIHDGTKFDDYGDDEGEYTEDCDERSIGSGEDCEAVLDEKDDC
jgi:Programmed cell death protein 2, C-terminal putative domain